MKYSDNEIMDDFAFLYNSYKKQDMIPKDIKLHLMKAFDCSESRYYALLRKCREAGLVKDSYKENRESMIERSRKIQQLVGTNDEPSSLWSMSNKTCQGK